MPRDPIAKLPPKEQDELVDDITNPDVTDDTVLQKYGLEALEALGYIFSPVYGLIKEGMGMYEQGPAEYFDRFGGVIGDIGGYLFGEPEQGIQASGSGQAGSGQGSYRVPAPKDRVMPYNPGRTGIRTAEVVQASDGTWHHPDDIMGYEEYIRRD